MILAQPKIAKYFIQSTLGLEVTHITIEKGTRFHHKKLKNGDARIFYTEVDILAQLQNGTQVIVEIQVEKQKGFLQRLLLYWSSSYLQNFERARQQAASTHVAYRSIQPVHVISILAANLLPDKEPFHQFKLRDNLALIPFVDEQQRDMLSIVFLELGKYDNSKLTGPLKHWFQFWGNLDIDKEADQAILDADAMLDEKNWNLEERQMILTDQLHEETFKDILLCAKEDGIEEGQELGKELGIEQTRKQIAETMLRDQIPLQTITKYTGLSEQELTEMHLENL